MSDEFDYRVSITWNQEEPGEAYSQIISAVAGITGIPYLENVTVLPSKTGWFVLKFSFRPCGDLLIDLLKFYRDLNIHISGLVYDYNYGYEISIHHGIVSSRSYAVHEIGFSNQDAWTAERESIIHDQSSYQRIERGIHLQSWEKVLPDASKIEWQDSSDMGNVTIVIDKETNEFLGCYYSPGHQTTPDSDMNDDLPF